MKGKQRQPLAELEADSDLLETRDLIIRLDPALNPDFTQDIMTSDTPLTDAWQRVRATVSERASHRRDAGHTALEMYADHGTITGGDDQPVTLSFTIPDSAAAELDGQIPAQASYRTTIDYADVAGTRLYILESQDTDSGVVVFVAGGISHRSLTDAVGGSERARTILRVANGSTPLTLQHAQLAPFLVGLDD